jgi:hypothetical protein
MLLSASKCKVTYHLIFIPADAKGQKGKGEHILETVYFISATFYGQNLFRSSHLMAREAWKCTLCSSTVKGGHDRKNQQLAASLPTPVVDI